MKARFHYPKTKQRYIDDKTKKALKSLINLANMKYPVSGGYNLYTPDMEVESNETSSSNSISKKWKD